MDGTCTATISRASPSHALGLIQERQGTNPIPELIGFTVSTKPRTTTSQNAGNQQGQQFQAFPAFFGLKESCEGLPTPKLSCSLARGECHTSALGKIPPTIVVELFAQPPQLKPLMEEVPHPFKPRTGQPGYLSQFLLVVFLPSTIEGLPQFSAESLDPVAMGSQTLRWHEHLLPLHR